MTPYTLKRSPRARRLSVTVYPTGRVVVTMPRWHSLRAATRFAESRRQWIERSVERFRLHPPQPRGFIFGTGTRREFREQAEVARRIAIERVTHFARRYGLNYVGISIRNQKTRWGSCSKKGNLSFSYRLAFLPPELRDYLVVHEVCHLKEFNHSRAFWNLVAQEVPNYRELRKRLKGVDT